MPAGAGALTSREARSSGASGSWKRRGNTSAPAAPRRSRLAHTLVSAQGHLCWTSDL